MSVGFIFFSFPTNISRSIVVAVGVSQWLAFDNICVKNLTYRAGL